MTAAYEYTVYGEARILVEEGFYSAEELEDILHTLREQQNQTANMFARAMREEKQ